MRKSGIAAVALVAMLPSTSCATFNNARPLEPGEHAVSVTAGGPILEVPGVGEIPFPHITLEGRHGLIEHLDVNYGVNLLPVVFGVTGGHVGASWQLNDQPDLFGPALTLGQRVYGFTDVLDPRGGPSALWGMSQTDFTASWLVFDEHLLYVGGTGYVPFNDPNLLLAPFAGLQIVPGVDWLRAQVEVRYLAPYVNTKFAVVRWIAPGDQGAISVNAGLAIVFGGDT